jgi:hypothetical protein
VKKRWRDQAAGKERISVAIGVTEREPGRFYGGVPLEWMRRLSTDQAALDGLLTDLDDKVPGLKIERDVTGGAVAVVGPVATALEAEAFANSLVQTICDTLGITRDGSAPEMRPAGEGFHADFSTSRRTDPQQLGGPPDDLPERLLHARTLASVTPDADGALTLLLAAWERLKLDKDPHPLEFVTLARAVVAWAPVRDVPQSELSVLEARGRHLAHLVSENISPSDQFVLLLCNTGEAGQLTHIGSMDRATCIELVSEFVEHLRADAERLS